MAGSFLPSGALCISAMNVEVSTENLSLPLKLCVHLGDQPPDTSLRSLLSLIHSEDEATASMAREGRVSLTA